MSKNKSMKLNEKMIKNLTDNQEDNEDIYDLKMLKEFDKDPNYKISKKEAVDVLSYMFSAAHYSLAEDLYVSVFSKTDRQELLNLISKVQNELKTIKC